MGGLASGYLQGLELTLTNVLRKNNEISYPLDIAWISFLARWRPVRSARENVLYGYLPRSGQHLLQPDQEIYCL